MRVRLPVDLHAWLVRVAAESRTRDTAVESQRTSMNTLALLLLLAGLDRLANPIALAETIDFDAPAGETVAVNLRVPGALHGRIVGAAGVATASTRRRVSAHRVIVSVIAAEREKRDPDPWAEWNALLAEAREQREKGQAAA